jgi:twitching motility protein PilT
MDKTVFQRLLATALQKGASDIHLQVGAHPLLRVNGDLLEIKYHPLAPEETHAVVEEIVSQSISPQDIDTITEIDLSYNMEGYGRFRTNIFRQRGFFNVVLRVIPISVKPFAELNLPPVVSKIAGLRRGLVLVVGATGNGKSTTLASMIEHINNTRRAHILTIEDPIEFIFKNNKAVISQREVGYDTPSFAKATVAAMRQDPDVIYIGEMREQETVDVAMKAAETGHLVLSSLHTNDCVGALARLIGFYPSDQEAGVRKRLSDSLLAVIALRLMPMKDGAGRIPAVEILRVTRTIQECIRDASKTSEIASYMEKGMEMYEMQTFDSHLLQLVKDDKVDLDAAKLVANKPEELERAIMLDGA